MAVSVSFRDAPVATHPGKSGTYAEKFDPASSITIAYRMGKLLMFKPCLFKNTVESARCQVVGELAGNSHATGLRFVFKLAVTATPTNFCPPILTQHTKQCPYLHAPTMTGRQAMRLRENLGYLSVNE